MNKYLRFITDSKYRFSVLSRRNFYKNTSDKRYLEMAYKSKFDKKLDLKNPITFNEKLQWLKLYDRNPEYTKMVDKCEAKKYVAGIIGEDYIIPTLGVWESFDDINFDTLPEKFVLKCTHDSGGLVICRNKTSFDKSFAKKLIEGSLRKNYFWNGREWPYKDVKPRIIAEAYMEDERGAEGLTDYKFFCFNGMPEMLYVSEGLSNHSTARISFYDMNGKQMPFRRSDYSPIEDDIVLPANFEQMRNMAQILSEHISSPFVRIDLYSINGKTYFSEITFFPCSGMLPFAPEEWDYKLGELIKLPEKHFEK